MIKEAMEHVEELARETIEHVEERPYSTVQLRPVETPKYEPLKLNTLAGVVDYLKANIDGFDAGGLLLHVKGYDEVELVSSGDEDWCSRHELVTTDLSSFPSGFNFGRRHSVEDFIISLMSNFVQTPTTLELIKLVGNMTAERVRASIDDGHSQTVSSRSGVHLSTEVEVKNPILLRPYRTFREVAQPESAFVFRVHQREDELPQCALYEADGAAWKNEAIGNVREYLVEKTTDIAVIA